MENLIAIAFVGLCAAWMALLLWRDSRAARRDANLDDYLRDCAASYYGDTERGDTERKGDYR